MERGQVKGYPWVVRAKAGQTVGIGQVAVVTHADVCCLHGVGGHLKVTQ